MYTGAAPEKEMLIITVYRKPGGEICSVCLFIVLIFFKKIFYREVGGERDKRAF